MKFYLALLFSFIFVSPVFAGEEKSDTKTAQTENAEIDPVLKAKKEKEVDSYMPYLIAVQAKQTNDYETAAEYFKEAYEKNPDSELLRSELMLSSTILGKVEDAIPLAEEVIKKENNDLLSTMIAFTGRLMKDDYKGALSVLRSFSRKVDIQAIYPIFEFWTYIGIGNREKAIETLKKMDNPAVKSFYLFHSALYYDFIDDEELASHYLKMLTSEPGSLTLRGAQVIGNYALRHKKLQDYAHIVQAYRNTDKIYSLKDDSFFTKGEQSNLDVPPTITSAKMGIAEAFFDLATSLKDTSEETAIYFLQLTLKLDPDLGLARFLLGELIEKQARYDEAIEYFSKESEKSDIYYISQLRIGLIYYDKLKQYDKAEKVFKNLASLRDDTALPWRYLADMYQANKQYDKAIEVLTEALKVIHYTDGSRWYYFYFRGVAYERSGNWPAAEADLKKALELYHNHPEILNYLAYSWLERGEHLEEAMKMLTKAVELAPADGAISDSFGWAYYMQKNYEKAVEYLELALKLTPGSGVISDHLGDAYWRVGRKFEAKYQWRKALDVGQDLSEDVKQRIEEKLEKGLDAVGDKFEGFKK